MDDLTSVRELEADTPPLTDEARAAARARLLNAITRESRGGTADALSRRLVFRVAIAATAAAAVAGTAVVALHGKDSDSPRMTTLSAAQVLYRAADRSRSDSSDLPVPRNDQYLYTKEVTTRTWLKSAKVEKFTDESWLSVDGSKTSRYSYEGRILDEPPLGKHQVRWPPTEYAKLKKWPTDPDELLKLFKHPGYGSGPLADQMAFLGAVMLMRGPRVMPPGLQAAAFEAVAKLPDIVIDHDEVDALGRHGIGISYPKMTFGFIFDRETYAYLGLRQTGSTSGGTKYKQVKGLVKATVVDKLGQRP